MHNLFDAEDKANLAVILERAAPIRTRQQFFNWTQGVLQTLIPHEILICCISNVLTGDWHKYYHSASRYFKDAHFAGVCAEDGLLPRLIQKWMQSELPVYLTESAEPGPRTTHFDRAFLPALKELELRNAVVHGLRGPDGGLKSFLCFSRIHGPFSDKLGHGVHLLAPNVVEVLCRVLSAEGSVERNGVSISKREREILQWVRDGKSNAEIAQILELSPLTVKNHIQNIRAKLGVHTRGHAVARALSLGALKSGGH